jgi:hypothetical protein
MRTGIVPGRQDSPHRHTGLQAHRLTGTQAYRLTGIQKNRYREKQRGFLVKNRREQANPWNTVVDS